MMDGLDVDMVPFLTVEKGGETVDCVNLQGRDTLILGRYHACDIEVGHASCSRRHLEIQMVNSTRDIILTDLGSAHGTWVEGTRLAFMTPVVFNGSVTFHVAASTRTYRLHWKPVSGDPVSLVSAHSLPVSEIEKKQDMTSQTPSGSQSCLRQISENQDFGGGKSNFNGKQSRGGEKVLSSSALQQNENLSPAVLNSPGRRFGHVHRATGVASSPKLPMRRLAFSSLQPANDKHIHCPQTPRSSSSVKKSLADRATISAKPVDASSSKQQNFKSGASIPSKLWVRRGSSAPLPSLSTAGVDNNKDSNSSIVATAPPLSALIEDEQSLKQNSVPVNPSSSGTAAVSDKTKKNPVVSKFDGQHGEEYPSDKENLDPVRLPYKPAADPKSSECPSESISKDSSSSLVETIERKPFRPLFNPLPCTAVGYTGMFDNTADSYDSPNAEFNCRALSLPRPHHKHCPTARNLDQLLRRLKLEDSIEGRKKWHLVIDTNCLLDSESLKALKQLEGIKEVSVIIPKIVVRELDFLKHREGVKSSARGALNWIESCMVRIPNWIYVQKSSETLPIGDTPPPSPSTNAFPRHGDLMSPTNDDHILECAMIFHRTTHYGKVTLLSRDTALRIKAMAEGLLSESAVEFVESLLSPYSNRFLWAGSTAHGQTWVDSPRENYAYRGDSTPRVKSPIINNHVKELRHHISAQPRGLRVAVSE